MGFRDGARTPLDSCGDGLTAQQMDLTVTEGIGWSRIDAGAFGGKAELRIGF